MLSFVQSFHIQQEDSVNGGCAEMFESYLLPSNTSVDMQPICYDSQYCIDLQYTWVFMQKGCLC